MLDAATQEWLKKQRARGFSEDQLKQYLRNEGHSEAEINSAFSSPVAVNQIAGKPANLFYAVIGGLVLLCVILGILAYNNWQESATVSDMMMVERMEAQEESDRIFDQLTEAEEKREEDKKFYEGVIAEKDAEIARLKASQIVVVANQTETELVGLNETVINETELTVNETQNSETNETIETPETYVPEFVATEDEPFIFKNKTVYYYTNQPLTLKVTAFNEAWQDNLKAGRLYCIDEREEEFNLAKIECHWVTARTSNEYLFNIEVMATDWIGQRECIIELYNMDEYCEENIGGLQQESLMMYISHVS
ncbi:hypothetical protein ACFL0V_07165 [Nanoarchaeota archaeon]